MLNFNGVLCTTIEELEAEIIDLSDEQKAFARNDFYGIANLPPTYVQQNSQRLFGESYTPKIIDIIGARNLELAAAGTVVNTAALLQALSGIKELMNTGALKTARSIIASVSPSFPAYVDIFDKVTADITDFLVANEYE